MSDLGIATLTYSPAPDADGNVATSTDLQHLVEVAAALTHLSSDGPMFETVQLENGMVIFEVALEPWPTYGALNLARGLVQRAASEAKTPGELVEILATQVK